MAHTLHDASKVYQPGSPEDAARCLSQVVDHWLSKGEFRRAAQYMQTLAETYESMGDISKARPAYEAAAQWFEDERSSAIGNRLSLKAADLAALDGEYLAAIKRFEYAAKQTDPTNATRFFTTDYLFRAGVCHLALDLIGAKRALDNYRGPYPTFPPTDQFQLLADLLELAEQGDSEAFGLKVYRYEKLHTLNPWFKTIFNRWVSVPDSWVLLSVSCTGSTPSLGRRKRTFHSFPFQPPLSPPSSPLSLSSTIFQDGPVQRPPTLRLFPNPRQMDAIRQATIA